MLRHEVTVKKQRPSRGSEGQPDSQQSAAYVTNPKKKEKPDSTREKDAGFPPTYLRSLDRIDKRVR